MSRETFIPPEDMDWLRDTHLQEAPDSYRSTKYKSAVIHGNEDFPMIIELYTRAEPLVSDKPKILVWDEEMERYLPIALALRDQARNPVGRSGNPVSMLEFAQDIQQELQRRGVRFNDRYSIAEKGIGIAIKSAKKVGSRRVEYVSITVSDDDRFELHGHFGSDKVRALLGYPTMILTTNVNEAANYLETVAAIQHAPGMRQR